MLEKPASVKGTKNEPASVIGIYSDVLDYFTNKKVGTIFFMDIDEKFNFVDNLDYLESLLDKYNLSHLLILSTREGYHLICFDIRRYKLDYYELFTELTTIFLSDYEYSYKWILRLSEKGNVKAPRFRYFLINRKIIDKNISLSHIFAYYRFVNIPEFVLNALSEYNIITLQKTRFVKYLTWNY